MSNRKFTDVSRDGLGIARADWGSLEDPAETRANCLGVPPKIQALWTSHEADAKDAAKELCQSCPRRRRCVEYSLDSDARGGILGGFNFESTAERRLAEEWLGRRQPRVDRRRKPNARQQVAS